MEPLANQIRPTKLDQFVGQTHLVGPGKPLRQAITEKHLFSFILWGPPGVGKTTLAKIYAKEMGIDFYELSAVAAGKDDIKQLLKANLDHRFILFLDEIHRFNKAQQDFLLPFVEQGKLVLIGATTENPSFEVIPALLSRCRVYILKELQPEDIHEIIKRTKLRLNKAAEEWLVQLASGDARQAINLLENTNNLYGKVTLEGMKDVLQSRFLRYDKQGEEHYNTISAYIKSLRAGNVDAALYYLARLTTSGEDPKFIARRMVIFASEDIGLAQPTALVVANAVFQAVTTIGYPECAINLAHGTVYLAQAKKDRRAYDGLRAAEKIVQETGNLPIPLKLRNAPTKLMKEIGYGKDYQMYQDHEYLPEEISQAKIFKDLKC